MVFRYLVCVMTLLAGSAGRAGAEEFKAIVYKVEGGMVTFSKRTGEPPSRLERTVLRFEKNARVFRGKPNLKTRTLDPGEECMGGIDSPELKNIERRGLNAVITTDENKAITSLIVLLPPLESVGPPVPDQYVSNLSAKELAEFDRVMTNMKENRDLLRTGIYRVSGQYSDVGHPSGDMHAPVEMFGAFDRPAGNSRFDRSMPIKTLTRGADQQKGDKQQQAIAVRTEKTRVIRTNNQVIAMGSGITVRTFSPADQATFRVQGLPIDVRGFGLYSPLELIRPYGFDEIHKARKASKPRELVRDENSVWKIVWKIGPPHHLEIAIWVDQTKGYSVARSQARSARHDGKSWIWQSPSSTSEVTWIQQDGVWVPKTYKLVENRRPDWSLTYDLTLQWESVNKPVPEELFTRESLSR